MIKVLIVEDDPMVADFNKRYVEHVEGFKVEATVPSVNEALALLDRQVIDLILLDIFMPGLNGIELLSQIRKIGKSVDVIIVSAACDSTTIKKALQYGAVDYLIKPFEFDRLSTALMAYKDRSKLMKDREKLSQADLDKQILYKTDSLAINELPKGLTRNTLKTVWEKIKELHVHAFTTEEIAQHVGISRVSMRKYLIFLSELGVIETEVIYGSIGRPIYKHRYLESKDYIMNSYL